MSNVQFNIRKAILLILCLVLLLTTLVIQRPLTVHAATGNPWYDKYVDWESAYSGSHPNPVGGGVSHELAWTDSGLMRSYINMYELTADISWLEKYVDRMDTTLSYADDKDGDGYLGWDTPRYSKREVNNYNFSEGGIPDDPATENVDESDSTLPLHWERFQGSSTTAYLNDQPEATCPTETDTAVIKNDNGAWVRFQQPLLNYEPGMTYEIKINAKTSNSAHPAEAFIYDRTTSSTISGSNVYVSSTSFDTESVQFTMPSTSGHDLWLYIGFDDKSATETYEFKYAKVTLRTPYMVHDAMIAEHMARYIRLVDETSSIQNTNIPGSATESYQTKADEYLAFFEDEIFPSWESSTVFGNSWEQVTTDTGYYTFPPNLHTYKQTSTTGPGVILPYNMQLAYARALFIIRDVNFNSIYMDRAADMMRYFKDQLTVDGAAYTWDYSGYKTTTEDASHGGLDIAAALESYQHGMILGGSSMDRFVENVNNMWKQNASGEDYLTYYVDGTEKIKCGSAVEGTLYNWWTGLAQFDNKPWELAKALFENKTLTSSSHPLNGFSLTEIMKWDPVKVVNQGFELKDDWTTTAGSNLPARWTRYQGDETTIYMDNTEKVDGDYGLTIAVDGTMWYRLEQEWTEWEAGAQYELTFDGKVTENGSGVSPDGKVYVYNSTGSSTLGSKSFSNTSWQSHSFTFYAPSTSTNIVELKIRHNILNAVGSKVHVDNVKIKRVGDSW